MSLFENIRDGKEPSNIIYQDEFITAFDDKYPAAPVHILIIPNKMIKSLDNLTDEDEIYMGKILLGASKLAKIKNIHEEDIIVVQIAGLIARRIVNESHEKQELKQGERIGMIRFGSRADLYFENYKPLVKVNQKTIAGETLLAKK